MERGNTTHGARVDDELEKEDRAFVQGHPSPSHVEEFRQTEGFPDDTDPEEVDEAAGMSGALVDDEVVFETRTGDDDVDDLDGEIVAAGSTEETPLSETIGEETDDGGR
ncbi:hypothetical protein GCM10010988_13890 [Cnuibacter physcomitrellae]|uniref:Uncharacterized protein n=1 Tax=Cnuibacter physcomitrellae TaxID=1619308 RepID=A0A1X9LP18_9MICO|nr:hypothetical protein [Cnuibacter physcomitrellae]ARJ06192.1 hypothetical protein B5808_13900 [Cnuibacter physcomitrellae]GGI37424.1 hypothetical protein GCM10010988_13890 [Cnuibacter physcomitrellae]